LPGTAGLFRAVPFLLLFVAVLSGAQESGVPVKTGLSVEAAVSLALGTDGRIGGALLDFEASKAKVTEAERRRIPSLSISASYTRLSKVDSSITLGPLGTMSIDSPEDAFAFTANLQYPVFAGFRLRESVRLAELQSMGKELAAQTIRNAVAFETRRAYWETARAGRNVEMLQENLSLMERNRDVVKQRVAQGTVLKADLLSAQARCDQAEMDLDDAEDARERAYLNLEALVSASGGADGKAPVGTAASRFTLTSKPEDPPLDGRIAEIVSDGNDVSPLLREALGSRPETKAAILSEEIAGVGKKLAEAPLYPVLSVNGNLTYANPNSRVYFQATSAFTGTWNVGVALSYDLGGLPANLVARDAQEVGIRRSGVDRSRQEELITMDVRDCLLSYKRAKRDLGFVTKMLEQAKESERVSAQQVKRGTASDLDLLTVSTARLRNEYAIVNKEIDLQIAAADLRRSVGAGE